MTQDFHAGVLFLRCKITETKPNQASVECVRLKKEMKRTFSITSCRAFSLEMKTAIYEDSYD